MAYQSSGLNCWRSVPVLSVAEVVAPADSESIDAAAAAADEELQWMRHCLRL